MEEKVISNSGNNGSGRSSLYGFEMKGIDRRRVPAEERKTHDINQLWQRNHEILNLAVMGMKGTEIAEVLNIHVQTVSNTLNSELGMKKLSEMREERDKKTIDVIGEVDKLLPLAVSTYQRILAGEEVTKLQKETADTLVMDIGGHRAPAKLESAHLYLTKADVEEFKRRGIEAAKSSGMIVESEVENTNDDEDKGK